MTRIVFQNGTVFDGRNDGVLADVVIEDGKVVDVGSSLDGDEVVDCAGKTVMPGFFDCHVHVTVSDLNFAAAGRQGFSLHYYQAARNMARLLDTGFTWVRDAAGADLGMKQAVERGLIDGPRLQITISMISQTGGHFDRCLVHGDVQPMPAMMAAPGKPDGIADGPDEVRRKVREMFRAGADCIKTATSGGVMSPGDDPNHAHYRDDEIASLVAEAAAVNSYVLAHSHSATGIKAAVRAGVRSIEHGFYIDDEAIELMIEKGTWFVPTLTAAHLILEAGELGLVPDENLSQMKEAVETQKEGFRRAVAAGVKIAMGSDMTSLPWNQGLMELGLMAAASDMKPIDCWRTTTSSAAELMMLDDRFGTLEPGKVADVVVLDGPLDDLSGLRERVEQVWKDGVRVR